MLPIRRSRRLVLISHQFSHNDGQGRVNYEVALRALQRGDEVTLLATECAPQLLAHPRLTHVRINNGSLPTAILRNLAFARATARWLRRHRAAYDLVLANGFITWEPVDINVAHFVHTTWANHPSYPFRHFAPYALYQRLYTALNARWEKPAFRRATRVVAVSDVIAREVAALGVSPDRITTIVNGMDTEQFHPGPAERSRFGLPARGVLALFAGDIKVPRKNLETVLAALQRVPDLSLAVAGAVEGSPYPAMVQKLGLTDRVLFLGAVHDMPALMRSVDFFVFPSRYEPFGLVVTEAMASGVPVIVSACAGAASCVGKGGLLLCDPDNVDELATAMQALAGSAERREAMGKAGREQTLSMQWSSMADAYVKVFDDLCRPIPSAKEPPAPALVGEAHPLSEFSNKLHTNQHGSVL